MTSASDIAPETTPGPFSRQRLQSGLLSAARVSDRIGLGWFSPLLRMAAGEPVKQQLRQLWQRAGIPLIALGIFVVLWGALAPRVVTSLGSIPGPAQVLEQAGSLYEEHLAERHRADDFYARQQERNDKFQAAGETDKIKWRSYTGKPTYLDQIATSLKTVFMGFFLATAIAVPLGILCGLSPTINAALGPLIQLFKPVSPLAWLPIVTMVVSALYTAEDPLFDKAFLNSAITVTLCSLWPTLINTAVGVASIDRELMNVSRVLQLKWPTKTLKLVLPSALPYIFTGLRLSLGVGWMVLIAAEMLAQNPGLGKFVWDEFQNGSSSSLARIMVAVFTIGIIGFVLDRIMAALQALFSHGPVR